MALNVKVGDKVIYVTNHYKKIATVTKVTPTGRIRVDCSSSQFNENGREIGGDTWSLASLWEYDEKIAEQIKIDSTLESKIQLYIREIKEYKK